MPNNGMANYNLNFVLRGRKCYLTPPIFLTSLYQGVGEQITNNAKPHIADTAAGVVEAARGAAQTSIIDFPGTAAQRTPILSLPIEIVHPFFQFHEMACARA
jgi:hypothetical protein